MSSINFEFVKDSLKRTPQGFLKVKARANRTGIQVYTVNGKTVKRYRPDEEVFSKDSLETLKNLPITVEHPKEPVTIENVKKYEVGHTTEYIKMVQDGDKYTEVELLIKDLNTIDKIEKNLLCELSCGYSNDIEKVTGIYNNDSYDEIQRNIVYNHLALLPPFTARAGRKARILLTNDSKEFIYDQLEEEIIINDKKEVKKQMKIKLNGMEFEVDDLVGQAFNNQITTDSNSVAELQKKLDETTKERDELKGKIVVLDSEKANQPNINELIKNRLAFFDKAKSLVQDSKNINVEMSEKEIKIAVIKDRLPEFVIDSSATDGIIDGAFMTLKPIENQKPNNLFKALGDATKNMTNDSKDKNVLSPREKMLQNIENASKGDKK